MIVVSVPAGIHMVPLIHCLTRLGISQTQKRKMKRSGTIYINNAIASLMTPVSAGDHITVDFAANKPAIVPRPGPLSIVYEDDSLLIADKPAGMLVHPTVKLETGTLANAVLFYYQQQNLLYDFHPVTRLDKNTSGLVLIAKQANIHRLLNNPEKITKEYLAIAGGSVISESGIIDAPIQRHPDSIIQRIIHPDGQSAVTHFRVLQRFATATLVSLKLITGRTHQIRVHMAYIGHPLLGDDLYGGSEEKIDRQALHAAKLELLHPISGKAIQVSSSMPPDMQELLKLV
ncbi:RluA family pseudouridine synthase [Acetonema longum]|uniref:Pseudouridine synthase n=1 Tax=Acetonema longum DSM 6540 TaxID=1009370 RepID=F7NDH6_9FIRM|nr:RluA family pseudouridine synthase [Acetonema longum]EGO65929.1 pseudouridine synthase [Acetonema longum DSM 6540]